MNFRSLNCTTCRFELSQCLDGRLPSGRRAEVMNHAESCATCGSFWLELQAAQRLTLSLRATEVSSNFREGLWQRIHAGEGTPSAVFQEEVPLWSKVRYTLTGAAAAAALLIGVTFLTKDQTAATDTTNVAQVGGRNGERINGNVTDSNPPINAELVASNGDQSSPLRGTLEPRQLQSYETVPFISAAKKLSMELVAVETARQLEERYATAEIGMRMLKNPSNNSESAINKVLRSAHEMGDFGELLLDLRDRQRLFFTDAGIGYELQYAVNMLTQAGSIASPTQQTVEQFVAPVLASGRLAHVSRSISLKPSSDHEERRDLWRVNTMRPEVMAKLFVPIGNHEQMRPGTVFLFEGDCDFEWVAPISEINAHSLRIRFGVSADQR